MVLQALEVGVREYPSKYAELLDGFLQNPGETLVYVPFQDTPNLPGFKINTLERDGRVLYHGLAKQPGDKIQRIPIFSSLDEVQDSYKRHFEMVSLPISEVIDLIDEGSSAQGLMLDMFTLNGVLGKEWMEGIKEARK